MRIRRYKPVVAVAGFLLLSGGVGVSGELEEVQSGVLPSGGELMTGGSGAGGWGWELGVLYLQQVHSDGDIDGEPWEPAYRGGISFEDPTGLWYQLNGFYTGGKDVARDGDRFDLWYVEVLMGGTVQVGDHTTIGFGGGLRYAEMDAGDNDMQWDGVGPTFLLEAQRAVSGDLSIYSELQLSLMLGDSVGEGDGLVNTVAEVRAGIQHGLGSLGLPDYYVRLGIEGQVWMAIDEGEEDPGLLGGALSFGGKF